MRLLAFDPGKVTGISYWEGGEHLHSAQGTCREMCAEGIVLFKGQQITHVAVEGTFVGPNNYSALRVTDDAGFIKGALWCAGFRGELWEPKANSWRSLLKFPGSRAVAGECMTCDGTGDLNKNQQERLWDVCPDCDGSGEGPGRKQKSTGKDYEQDALTLAREILGQPIQRSRIHEAEAICIGQAYANKLATRNS